MPDLRRTAFGRPLDHLYYRNLDLVEVSSPATDSSDHNPILARFAAQAITPELVRWNADKNTPHSRGIFEF